MAKFLFPLVLALLIPLLVVLAAVTAHAGEAVPLAADPVLEARLNKLSETLRCLVCQNQSIADSHAELAVDLKNQVREMMIAGRSDDEIVAFLVQRYGDFVLFKPPLKPTTTLLWFGPALLFFIAIATLIFKVTRQRRRSSEALPDAAARAQAQALLAGAGREQS
jgi:cytochrome c-type biogenesis protein CcmH